MSKSTHSLIFVSAPYKHRDPAIEHYRLKVTAEYCLKHKQEGRLAINPTIYGLALMDRSEIIGDDKFSSWDNFCYSILAASTVVHVLKFQGWEQSRGVQAEIEFANNNNIPVQYYEIMHEGFR